MRCHGVKRLAFASTSAIYGISTRFPIPENAPLTMPISLYGATKLSCEAMISAFQRLFSMQCWILRLANIVGPKSRQRGCTVVSDFIRKLRENPHRLKILGNGKQAKSYLLSSECVEAILFAVEHAREPMNIFNVGCDDWLPVSRIAELVVEAMGLGEVEFDYGGTDSGWPGDVPRFLLDVSAINHLGWKARHNSEKAVRVAICATLAAEGTPAEAGR
jgi:UDP-glucose 4-epimerase